MCHGIGAKHSFLCPNTTIFNQRLLVCDWHSKVLCESSESFYSVNDQLYKHSPKKESRYNSPAKENYNSRQNPIISTPKYRHSINENYNQNKLQSSHTNEKQNVKLLDVPKFVVKHFKENIPNAEFGRPKGISKSYSAVIAKPKNKVSSTIKNPINQHYYLNVNKGPLDYDQSPKSERMIPGTFLEDQRSIKNSWNSKEMEKKLEHDLLTIPEKIQPYQGGPNRNTDQRESHNTRPHQGTKIIIPLNNNENSYYDPQKDEFGYVDDDIDDKRVAGRQNDKIIVINKKRLKSDFESSESRESLDPGSLPESRAKFIYPERTTATQAPFNNRPSHQRREVSAEDKNVYRTETSQRNQNSGHNEIRVPQYIYPLPGIVQNNDGTEEFNYGYRTEDPTDDNMQKSLLKKKPSTPKENNLLRTEKYPLDERIKWRIAEIKSGVESISAQVGNILGGTDGSFKNVRIFKLKPDSSSGDLEEIKLSPFKFQRQSETNPLNSKLKEKKRQELKIKVIRDDSTDPIEEFRPKAHLNPSQDVHSKKNANYGYKPNQTSFQSAPRATQEAIKPTYPNHQELSGGKTTKAGYGKSAAQLRSYYDQNIKLVPNVNPIKTPENSGINKKTNTETFSDNIHINPNKYLQNTQGRLSDHNTQMRIPSKTPFNVTPNKNEMKLVPLIKVSEVTKPRVNGKYEMKTLPMFKNENSETFQNIYIPKKVHDLHPSTYIYPHKNHKPTDFLIKTKPAGLQQLKLVDFAINQYAKPNFDNIQIIQTKVNGNGGIKETDFLAPQNNNQQLFPTTTKPLYDNGRDAILVLSKPTANSEIFSNEQSKTKSSNYQSNNLKNSQSLNPKLLTRVPNAESNGCDDSVSSNANSYSALLLQLGKNGPPQESIQVNPMKGILDGRKNGDFKSYYNPSGKNIKCRNNNNIQKQMSKNSKKPINEIGPPKIIFRELTRPKHSHTPTMATNTKTADESVQVRSRPVKLFKVQRNARPAAVRPATAIPVTSLMQEARGYYYPPGIIRQVGPVNYYQGRKEIYPPNYYRGRHEQPVALKHISKPVELAVHSQERRELRPVYENQRQRTRPTPGHVQDNRGLILGPKKEVNDKKYIDLERAAERESMVKSHENEKNVAKNFPAVRTRPQGQIRPQEPEVHTENSGNHSKNSKYAAIEKEAELKAERMVRNKSQSKQ